MSCVHAMYALGWVEITHSKWGGEGCDCSFGLMMIDDGIGRLLFCCHVAVSDMAPGFNNG
jgi:hypothetical protein